MEFYQILLVGSISGFTIFLGMPLVMFQNISKNKKGFLNAITIGILLFPVTVMFSHVQEHMAFNLEHFFVDKQSLNYIFCDITIIIVGIAIGLLGLVFYESIYTTEQLKKC